MSGIILKASLKGMREVEKELRNAAKLTEAHTRKRLHYWGRRAISSVRKSRPFRGGHGALMQSLWTAQAESQGIVQHVGWGLPYGEVLEWGPAFKKTWTITPRGFRSDVSHGRSGGGVALQYLRFVSRKVITRGKRKGQRAGAKYVVYCKEVTHRWTTKEKRPHFEPVLDALAPRFARDMGDIAARVLSGELT